MFKKTITISLIILMFLSAVFASGKSEKVEENEKTLEIWGFASEVKTFSLAYEEAHPDTHVNYTLIPLSEYTTKVKAAISSGDVPDVICLEAAFVKNYVESDYLLPLDSLLAQAPDLHPYQYTLDIGSNNGQTKALSYQATPGALFYRRSLAKEYFGTDDPEKIQALLSNMDQFKAAAAVVHDKSDGNTFMVGSSQDFLNLYYSNRTSPWVVNHKLNIDQQVINMIKVAKEFRDNDWEAKADPWSAGWYNGINDSLEDAAGNKKQIFCYLLPTWGLSSVLMENCEPKSVGGKTVGTSTFGDWACIRGPMPYFWGGTWFAILDEAKHLESAKSFIQFSTLNKDTLSKWALGTYTNQYLKKIDPTINDSLKQGAGDFISSDTVAKEITPIFDNSQSSAFLSGQNAYQGFADAAPYIKSSLLQGTDGDIQNALYDPMESYVEGKITLDQCLENFKKAVRTSVPDVTI